VRAHQAGVVAATRAVSRDPREQVGQHVDVPLEEGIAQPLVGGVLGRAWKPEAQQQDGCGDRGGKDRYAADRAAIAHERDVPDLVNTVDWTEGAGLIGEAVARGLRRRAKSDPGAAASALRRARRVRAVLRDLYTGLARGDADGPGGDAFAELLKRALDRSRNGLRRWREMETCGTQAKARRRRKGATLKG
jgi:hypothetical protein